MAARRSSSCRRQCQAPQHYQYSYSAVRFGVGVRLRGVLGISDNRPVVELGQLGSARAALGTLTTGGDPVRHCRHARNVFSLLVAALVLLPHVPAAQAPATLRVYLARHGQTDGNLKGIAQGWTDTPLNETGRQHATLLAERLRGVTLDGIY